MSATLFAQASAGGVLSRVGQTVAWVLTAEHLEVTLTFPISASVEGELNLALTLNSLRSTSLDPCSFFTVTNAVPLLMAVNASCSSQVGTVLVVLVALILFIPTGPTYSTRWMSTSSG